MKTFIGLIAFIAFVTFGSAHNALAQESESFGATTRGSDAASDRGIFFNRAETIGEGNTTFNAYELVFAGLTHAWSDDAQATVNFLMPITKDWPIFMLSNAKFVVTRTQNLTLALQGELSYQSQNEDSGGSLGGVVLVDYYLSPRFSVHGQMGINTVWADDARDDDGLSDGWFDIDAGSFGLFRMVGGASYALSDLVRLNTEVVIPGGYADGEFELVEEATLIFYGARFAGKNISADLGFTRPLVEDAGELVMGVPWVSFAASF
jgi:hypothetical protein